MSGKEILCSLVALIVIVGVYLCSYGYFDDHHSHFYFASGEDILLVSDTIANRTFAIFYAPISYAVHTPICFAPKATPSSRPSRAFQQTETGGEACPTKQP